MTLGQHSSLILIPLVFVLAACDIGRWEVKEDKTGRVLKVDRWFGDVFVADGERFVRVKNPEALAAAAEPRRWPDVKLGTIAKDFTASLKTSWRRGQLYYQFQIAPALEPPADKGLLSFTVELYDGGGFQLMSIPVPFSGMTKIVDDNGKATSRL